MSRYHKSEMKGIIHNILDRHKNLKTEANNKLQAKHQNGYTKN